MHAKAKLSKIILQNNVALEDAAQEKVCQTDKCSAHGDNKKCYVRTVMQTISNHFHQVAPDHHPLVISS